MVAGPDLGTRFVLPPGRSVLGRAQDALSSPEVSRQHLELWLTRGGVRWRSFAGQRERWRHWERDGSMRIGATRLVLRREGSLPGCALPAPQAAHTQLLRRVVLGTPPPGYLPAGAAPRLAQSGQEDSSGPVPATGVGPARQLLPRFLFPLAMLLLWPAVRKTGWAGVAAAVASGALAWVLWRFAGRRLVRRWGGAWRRRRAAARLDPARLLYSAALRAHADSGPSLSLAGGHRPAAPGQAPLTLYTAAGHSAHSLRVRPGQSVLCAEPGGIELARWLAVQALAAGWVPVELRAGQRPPRGEEGRFLYLSMRAAAPDADLVAAPSGPLPGPAWQQDAQTLWDQRAAASDPASSGQVDPFALVALNRAELAFARQRPRLAAPVGFAAPMENSAPVHLGAPPGPSASAGPNPPLGSRASVGAGEQLAPAAQVSPSQGLPVVLDLERAGPHMLVAGRTGSGKSEFLTFFLSALALLNPPAALNLVLFDYKGGATFSSLRGLPHTMAVLTDLDVQASHRALEALGAELCRRERLLAGHGARDVRELAPAARPPALLVAVDEFRVLRDSHPDLLDTLLRLAAQGRSLGMHLVLATQRPAGAISPDIAANTSIRLSLRLSSEADSRDVLGHSRAAGLPSPGWALLQAEEEALVCCPPLGSGPHSWRERAVEMCLELGGGPAAPLWAPALPPLLLARDVASPSCPFPALVLDDVAGQSWRSIGAPDRDLLIAGAGRAGKSTAAAQLAWAAAGAGARVCVVADAGEPAWAGLKEWAGVVSMDRADQRHLARLLDSWLALAPGSLAGAFLFLDDAERLDAGGQTAGPRVEDLVRAFQSRGGRCVLTCTVARHLAALVEGRLLLPGAGAELLPRASLTGTRPPQPGTASGAGIWRAESWLACQVTCPDSPLPLPPPTPAQREWASGCLALPDTCPRLTVQVGPALRSGAVGGGTDGTRAVGTGTVRAAAHLDGPGQGQGQLRLLLGATATGPYWVEDFPVAVIGAPGPERDALERELRSYLPTGPGTVRVGSDAATVSVQGGTNSLPSRPTLSPQAECAFDVAQRAAEPLVVAASAEEALAAFRGPLAQARAEGTLLFVGPLSRAARSLSPHDLGAPSVHRHAVLAVRAGVYEVRLCQELRGVGVEHCTQHRQGEDA